LHATLNGKNRRIFRQLRLDPINHHFPHCVHLPAKTFAREPRSGETDNHCMAGGEFLADWALRHHAGSHSFVLRAEHIPSATA
jgi:hypothetical protein